LLGRIISNVTGESYSAHLRKRLLDPLGMDETHLDGREIGEEKRAKAYNWIDHDFVPEPFLDSDTVV